MWTRKVLFRVINSGLLGREGIHRRTLAFGKQIVGSFVVFKIIISHRLVIFRNLKTLGVERVMRSNTKGFSLLLPIPLNRDVGHL